jgi:hypothetical protein
MQKPKGGRGVKAPYDSTHVRIPSPLKTRVEVLKRMYFDGIPDYEYMPDIKEAMIESKKIVDSCSSSLEVAEKILEFVYGCHVSLEEVDIENLE